MPPRHRFIAHLIRRGIAAGDFSPSAALNQLLMQRTSAQ
ncbi:hypothetical protein EV646_116150 [Kribbella antiqua]|uniref:Uncharacterized protein n=1 Tax=Kribbella antiqua TaxID=2512217 RepID=A0A4R2IC59_9ACTN|nr:hypothetical protein EV646_116150 [Kribbella antiqua]